MCAARSDHWGYPPAWRKGGLTPYRTWQLQCNLADPAQWSPAEGRSTKSYGFVQWPRWPWPFDPDQRTRGFWERAHRWEACLRWIESAFGQRSLSQAIVRRLAEYRSLSASSLTQVSLLFRCLCSLESCLLDRWALRDESDGMLRSTDVVSLRNAEISLSWRFPSNHRINWQLFKTSESPWCSH